jgi:sulfoxide reductase catalytic subunit YedY
MSIADKIPDREITPERVYLGRRIFMKAGVVAATAAATGVVYRRLNRVASGGATTADLQAVVAAPTGEDALAAGLRVEEAQTSFESITHYNNFYEFSTNKEGVAQAAAGFTPGDWRIAVEGLASKPRTFGLDDLLTIGAPEERIYRMRCVEGWSMVIPWAGLPLRALLQRVEPLSAAKYVAFQTLLDPQRMPNQRTNVLRWPYVEGLRMDEAMHPLAILATGIYGKALPPQDGAPVRLVVPWKYGFKGIKSIVKITLVADEPSTTWSQYAPSEYGFYANVNPQVDHPRWSQATEQRIGESGRRPTLMFNGYERQVAGLYAGMDLRTNF